MILFIKHIDIEGPETFSEFFEGKGFDIQIIELQNGESLPENLEGIQAVVSLGGPMNVYDEEKHSFLKEEGVFIRKVIAKEIPFMGLCLGSQLLAKACEAKVGKSPEKEIGFFPMELTAEGKSDPLFEDVPGKISVFQWHEDMSDIPSGASLLASSQGCPHQAFKVGHNAYGLQFHIEITEKTIQKWADAYFDLEDTFRMQQKRCMMQDYESKKELFHQMRDRVYNNFLKVIRLR